MGVATLAKAMLPTFNNPQEYGKPLLTLFKSFPSIPTCKITKERLAILLGSEDVPNCKKPRGYAELTVKETLNACTTMFSVTNCAPLMSKRLILLFKAFLFLKDNLHFTHIKPLYCFIHAKPFPCHKVLQQSLAERKKG
ncbi:hypothetical protein KP509_05G028000 [Ceratopteris richardii]|uniref:Uncharacterized protein n=1 Tax=Ceratopteris richardii TaxID=49495 RepID=A0A8T2UT82_CERRI|nr:hypothetical protein KP509_05G028000 [Ceratopteris richardii]